MYLEDHASSIDMNLLNMIQWFNLDIVQHDVVVVDTGYQIGLDEDLPTQIVKDIPLTLSQWSSSGNPVCLELRPQCTLECHWRNASVLPVVFQWSSSGFPVVFQCVPIMQINTGSPLGHHWVLASASVVPVASQCTCGSSGLPVCSNYAN